MSTAVERETGQGLLALVFAGARPDNCMGKKIAVATPAVVSSATRPAVSAGWTAGNGGPVFFGVANGRLGASLRTVRDQHRDASAPESDGEWQPYDPAWLVSLVKVQHPEPDNAWLCDALRACTRVRPETRAYVHFVDPSTSAWRFARNIILQSEEQATLVLDILEGDVVGGLEFLNRL